MEKLWTRAHTRFLVAKAPSKRMKHLSLSSSKMPPGLKMIDRKRASALINDERELRSGRKSFPYSFFFSLACFIIVFN
jgi:hypothetical protein